MWAVALRRAFSFPIRTLRASTPRCMSRPTRYGWRRTTREPRSVCRRRGRRGPSLQGTRPVPARYCFWVPHWFVSPGESLLQPAHGRSSRSSARIRHRAARCRQCRDSRTGMQCLSDPPEERSLCHSARRSTPQRHRRRHQRTHNLDPWNAVPSRNPEIRRRSDARRPSRNPGIHRRSAERRPSRILGILRRSAARRLSWSLAISRSGHAAHSPARRYLRSHRGRRIPSPWRYALEALSVCSTDMFHPAMFS